MEQWLYLRCSEIDAVPLKILHSNSDNFTEYTLRTDLDAFHAAYAAFRTADVEILHPQKTLHAENACRTNICAFQTFRATRRFGCDKLGFEFFVFHINV